MPATLVVIAGLLLIWTGLTLDCPKSFEDEVAELDPDLKDGRWSSLDDQPRRAPLQPPYICK